MCVKWLLICSVQNRLVRGEGLMFLLPWFFHQFQGDLLACYSHLGPLWYWLLAMLPLCIDQSVVDEQKSKGTLLALSFEMEQPISASVLGQLPGESRRNIFLFYLIFKCYFIWIYIKLLIRSIFPLFFSFYNGWYEILVSTGFLAIQKKKILKIKTVKRYRPLFDGLDLSVIYRGWACCLNLTKRLHTDRFQPMGRSSFRHGDRYVAFQCIWYRNPSWCWVGVPGFCCIQFDGLPLKVCNSSFSLPFPLFFSFFF